MLRSDDSDIDALLGSVVGGSGEPVDVPDVPERATRRAKAPRVVANDSERAAAVAKLSGELAEQLDASEEERAFVDPRTVPVRFSNLKHMARSALHYLDAVQLDRADTLAMRLGRGAHAMVLGLPVVRYPGRRAGKAWEAFQAARHGVEIMSPKEWVAARGMADAIRRHPIAAPILFDGTTLEETIEWEWLGRKCTSRPDARRGGAMIADLKTTQCAEPEKFKRDALFRGYNAQLAFYALAVEHRTGRAPDDLYIVAVESKRPWAVTVLRLDDAARLQGEKLCRLWFERLLVCLESNHWPAYTDAIVPFSAPSEGTPGNAIDLDNLDEELFA